MSSKGSVEQCAPEILRVQKLRSQLGLPPLNTSYFDWNTHALEEIGLMMDIGMPNAVSVIDDKMRYVYLNSAAYSMFGLERDEIGPGSRVVDAHSAMVRNGLLDDTLIEESGITSGIVDGNENRAASDQRILPLRDGRYIRVIRKKLGNGYVVSTSEDITKLVLNERFLDNALILGNSGYWFYDFTSRTYQISKSLSLVLKPEHVEIVKQQGPIIAVHPDDRAKYRDAIKNITRTHDRFEVITRYGWTENPYWFSSTGMLIRSPNGEPKQLQCFVQNITREKYAEMRLERAKDEAIAASMAKSQFLANMSHEIRTPMNGVLGMAELLASSSLDDRQRDFVNVITRSATSLLTVINDILDFSKIEADALELDEAPFSLRDIVAETTTLLSPNAAEKNIELIVSYSDDQMQSFVGDGVRVRQILTNLVGNAIKFTDKGHVLTDVNVVSSGGQAEVTVKVIDTGIGIEADKLDKVFDKFTQADNSTTRIYGGTGLGLSISKRLVEMMDGEMSVTSTLGEGTTFTFTLPLTIDRSAKPVVRNTAPLHGKRALIIDDIDINRRLLTEQLAGWGMKSRAVSDGVEGLLALKQAKERGEPFDILIVDFLMPGVNGKELASMIHAQPEIDLPVLMLSSCDQKDDVSTGERESIDRYLVKPVREQALYDAVLSLLYDFSRRETVTPDAEDNTEPPHDVETDAPATNTSARQVCEVLVAEDFPLNQDVVRLMLADTRYRPVVVENGALAVELYTKAPHRFGAVLMDVSMPIMDGYMATQRIREHEREAGLERTPIIALTGHALTHEREKCLDAGMDDYLTKPVKQVELISALDRWTGGQTRMAVA